MARSGNTWCKIKMAKLKKQRQRDPMEVSHLRAGYAAGKAELVRIVAAAEAGFTGAVTVADAGPMVEPIGKKRRAFDHRTFGDFSKQRHAGQAGDYYSLWSSEGSRLIKK